MLKSVVFAFGILGSVNAAFAAGISPAEYGGCKENDYVTLDQAEVVIEFQGTSYSPACLIVKSGTKVTIPANDHHPLQAATNFDSVENPFRSTGAGFEEDQTQVMSAPGFYGYYCTHHGDPETGRGMGGVIKVIAP